MHRTSFIVLLGLAFAGCDCGDDVSVEIISPEDGAVFNLADDVDADREGVQIVLQAATDGLDLSTNVQVSVDGEGAGAAPVGAGGVVETQVTLEGDGPHVIKVSAEGASDEVTVTLDSTSGACPEISITSPRDGDTLTATDDEDDEPCGEFHYTIEVATSAQSGREATLYVNDNSIATAEVSGPSVVFDNVTLDSGDNILEVTLDGPTDCSAAASVRVDCGVTCTISDPTGDVLNIADGDDDLNEPGMQSDFMVETDAEDGQSARLVVDDEEPGESATVAGGSAFFPLVALAEGERVIQAVCRDAAGNEARSARVRFTVDTVPPDLTISEPHDNDVLNMQDDDQDAARDGLQVQVCATTDQDNELCAAVAGADPGPDGCANVDGDEACVLVDCNGDGVVIEATVADDFGNVQTDSVTVDCDAEIPVIVIDSPLAGEILNAQSDDDPNTAGLQTTVVACVDEGVATVDLAVNGAALASADVQAVPCQPEGLGAELPGTAEFYVTLPEGEDTLVVTGADDAGNPSSSNPVTVTVDSRLPTIAFTDPVCGVTVVGVADDEDLGAAGLQYDVDATLGSGVSVAAASISWEAGGGEALADPVVVGPFATFSNVTFLNGTNTITIDLIDDAGNSAQVDCDIRANEGGTIRITSPAPNTAFTYATDPDHGTPGHQSVSVTVTSDGLTDGSMRVCVQDSGAILIPLPACADYVGPNTPISLTLPEGTALDSGYDLVASTQSFEAAPPELFSSAVRVRVDTILPTTPVGLGASVVDVRAGEVTLSFTAPEDPTGRSVTTYQVRRSAVPFASENDGSVIGTDPTPVLPPGSAQTLTASDLVTAVNHYFAVRATDRIGNVGLSAVTAVPVVLSYTVDTVNSPIAMTDHLFGVALAGGSDVNDDGFDDVVVGSADFVNGTQRAYVFAGGVGGLGGSPLATVSPAVAAGFGLGVALLDNFNGDDAFADVAVSDFAADMVWVFNGGNGLTGAIDTGDASVTIAGVAGEFTGGALGYLGDVNGDGYSDLGIVASFGNGTLGVVYVVFGGQALPADLTLPGDADIEIRGVLANTSLAAAAPAGDVNGDDVDDILLGACAADAAGSAYVIYGGLGIGGVVDADTDLEIPAEGASDQGYGCTLGGVGDVDGNGFADVVVGSRDYGSDDRGAVHLVLSDGLGGFTSVRIDNGLVGNVASDYFGYSVASTTGIGGEAAPSFDPQVLPDIAIGHYRFNDGAGRANLIWGRANFVAGDLSVQVSAQVDEPAGASQMDALIFAGDVDGDGWVDVVAGDYAGDVGGGVRAGRIHVIR